MAKGKPPPFVGTQVEGQVSSEHGDRLARRAASWDDRLA